MDIGLDSRMQGRAMSKRTNRSTSRARLARVERRTGKCTAARDLLDLSSKPSFFRSTTRANHFVFSSSITNKTESEKTKFDLRLVERRAVSDRIELKFSFCSTFLISHSTQTSILLLSLTKNSKPEP